MIQALLVLLVLLVVLAGAVLRVQVLVVLELLDKVGLEELLAALQAVVVVGRLIPVLLEQLQQTAVRAQLVQLQVLP
jgi:hypothetical protein